jgi:beta-xylosidase
MIVLELCTAFESRFLKLLDRRLASHFFAPSVLHSLGRFWTDYLHPAHHLLCVEYAGGLAMISKQHLTSRDSNDVSDAIQLAHINSESCWCDPILEFDEDGNQSLIHNEVTWN